MASGSGIEVRNSPNYADRFYYLVGYGQGQHLKDVGQWGDPIWTVGFTQSGSAPAYLEGCFPKSELVHTSSDTFVPIGAIKIGDKISSWDMEHKKIQYTAVSGIHKYTVNEIMCFNNAMRVSSSHPLMVMEVRKDGMFVPMWTVAFNVNVGDYVIGAGGKLVTIKSKNKHWYGTGTEVLNLSTDSGVPFLVGNCIVRADNATDNITRVNTPITQKLTA